MNRFLKNFIGMFFGFFIVNTCFALEVGNPAPLFSLKNQEGKIISLQENKDKLWTVVYFYPKAGTPGCTTQACAFRDSIKIIKSKGAIVYGVSTDSVASLKEFYEKHKLTFDLLSDEDAKIAKAYGTKMAVLTMSKRITFIIDDKLVIRSIDENVDPALDAKKVADKISELRSIK
ncbi:peroxiredoxin [Fluviispira multicolorata]|uniref:thioredoxin-dependent peroxiredoxin n=1 Tax=Fluviispira multicolorata TaxID=2654512 RepID=A0A833JBW4_9BACT|nr:peroxiredoxin [Fluviispira multicolorata]KAB8029871.1 redoxin domain-containing protein [Fluviispira multicolorata]